MPKTTEAPFTEGQSVRPRWHHGQPATVVTITREDNGLGEPYWWVVATDEAGRYGCDARDLIACRCNCESASCSHAPGSCPAPADPDYRVDYIGTVCNRCAQTLIATGAGEYVHANV